MSLIFSFFVYTFLAALIYVGGCSMNASLRSGDKRRADKIMLFTALIFSIVSGIRYKVGMDCESYAEAYEDIIQGRTIQSEAFNDNLEAGFLFISHIFAAFHLPRFIYMGFWAFVEFFFFFKALQKRTFLIPFAGLVLILGPFYVSWMNGIRQSVAACIFFFSLVNFIDSKSGVKAWVKYIILILSASLIHTSALIALPLAFLRFYNFEPNKYICLGLLFLSFVVGHLSDVTDFLQYSETFLNILGYDRYADNIDIYLELESNITSYGPRRIILLLSHAIVILFSDNLFRKYKNDRFLRVSYLLFLIFSYMSEILISSSLLFMRPFMYCQPFVIICMAYTFSYLNSNYKTFCLTKKYSLSLPAPVIKAILVCALIIFCSYNYLDNISSAGDPDAAVIFKTYFVQ